MNITLDDRARITIRTEVVEETPKGVIYKVSCVSNLGTEKDFELVGTANLAKFIELQIVNLVDYNSMIGYHKHEFTITRGN